MPEFNLVVIFLLFLGFSFSMIFSVRYPLIFTLLLIALNERFFGAIPFQYGSEQLDLFRFGGVLVLFSAIVIQFVFFPQNYNSGFGKGVLKGRYLKYILIILGFVLFCTFYGGFIINNQPIRSLILRPTVFYYYFIYVYLSFFQIDTKQINAFFKIILFLSLSLAIIATIDAVFFGGTKIFGYSYTEERAGLIRKGVFTYGIILSYYYSLSNVFEKNVTVIKKSGYLLCAATFLFFLFFVLASRQVLLSCMIATTFIFLRKGFPQAFAAMLVFIFLILFSYIQSDYDFSRTHMGKLYSLSEKETSIKTSSIGVRREGIKFYFQHFKKTYGLGFGLMSVNPKYDNPVSEGFNKYGYNLNDISLTGIVFQFGVQALILIMILIWKIFFDCQKLLKKADDLSRVGINSIKFAMIHFTIVFPLTTVFFYREKAIYFAILFFLIDRMKYLQITEQTKKASGRYFNG